MIELTFHGIVPSFGEIGRSIKEGIKRKCRRLFKGEDICDMCDRHMKKSDIEIDYLGRPVCKKKEECRELTIKRYNGVNHG